MILVYNDTMNSPRLKRVVNVVRWPLGILVKAFLIIAVGMPLIYQGRIYRGVVVHGVKVGGMNKAQALAAVKTADTTYATKALVIKSGNSVVRASTADLGLTANSQEAVDRALAYGRGAGGFHRWVSIIRTMIGRTTVIGAVDINAQKLSAYTISFADDVAVSVQNATFSINGTDRMQPEIQSSRSIVSLAENQHSVGNCQNAAPPSAPRSRRAVR